MVETRAKSNVRRRRKGEAIIFLQPSFLALYHIKLALWTPLRVHIINHEW